MATFVTRNHQQAVTLDPKAKAVPSAVSGLHIRKRVEENAEICGFFRYGTGKVKLRTLLGIALFLRYAFGAMLAAQELIAGGHLMRYVMKQKLWAWGNDFTVKDDTGADRFFVDGKAISLGDQLSIQDMGRNELAFIRQKLLAWGPTYEISRGGRLAATVKEHLFTLLRYVFTVDVGPAGAGPEDLEVTGDFLAREYTFQREGRAVAVVSRKWFSWSDTYGVEVADGEDDVLILACTVVIDMVTEKHRSHD